MYKNDCPQSHWNLAHLKSRPTRIKNQRDEFKVSIIDTMNKFKEYCKVNNYQNFNKSIL